MESNFLTFIQIPIFMLAGALATEASYRITKYFTQKKDPIESLLKTGTETVNLKLDDDVWCEIDVEFKYYPWDQEKIILLKRFLKSSNEEDGYGYKK